MKHLLSPLILSLIFAQLVCAYEYKLQFTPPGGARGLIVAGYHFNNNHVIGNCSYYTYLSSGGRGSHPTTTYYNHTCSWDLYGNLISLTPGSAPVAPTPISTTGTEIVYAINGSSKTGLDTRGFGFVATPSSHFSWQTVNGAYAVIPYAVYKITATLISDGDFALDFDGAAVASAISGYITPSPGTATVSSTTCSGSVPIGTTCSVTVSYNPTTIACTADAYGYAYTNIDLSLITDAGANKDFTQGFTIIGVPICPD